MLEGELDEMGWMGTVRRESYGRCEAVDRARAREREVPDRAKG